MEIYLYNKHFCIKSHLFLNYSHEDMERKTTNLCGIPLLIDGIKCSSGEAKYTNKAKLGRAEAVSGAILKIVSAEDTELAREMMATIEMYKTCLVFKNPVYYDAEKMVNIKGWAHSKLHPQN